MNENEGFFEIIIIIIILVSPSAMQLQSAMPTPFKDIERSKHLS